MSSRSLLLGVAVLCATGLAAAGPTIETVAGNGKRGYNGDGKPALATSFNFPEGLYFDADGNLYVADLFNHRVRRIDAATRIVSTVAGNGVATGSIDGPGGAPEDDLGDGRLATEASLHNAEAVAWSPDGAIFVADRENRRLRIVDPVTGIITTLAGKGALGPALSGVPGTLSDLYPVDLGVDAYDDPLVLDRSGGRLAKVDRITGFIWNVSGIGSTVPRRSAVSFVRNSAGYFYFADDLLHEIRRVNPATGASIRIAGITAQPGYSGDGGPALQAHLNTPNGLALAANRYLFVADSLNNRVRMVDLSTGIIDTVAGNGTRTHWIDGEGGDPTDDLGDGGPAAQATFAYPATVELGPDGGLYVGDGLNYRVRRVSGFCLPGLPSPHNLTLTPSILWPPDHGMVEIQAAVAGCAGPVPATLVSVTSSEPDDDPGGADGHTTDDVQGAATGTMDLAFQVRAERSGTGTGRTYTATYEVDDGTGSAVQVTGTILVPHDLHAVKPLLDVDARESQGGTFLQWTPVQGAGSYSVVRGSLGNVHRKGAGVDLGALDCVAAGVTRTDLQGFEDGVDPAPGEGFFYLVGYQDGWTDSDGTDRLTMRPIKYTGGCS
ncbi:MAG TPA: hypothetical protein VNI57_01535 [Candidatus Saccharimonadales bacterium]|nr:hypothetical protein [Candidatus Saccharimonadales bacterium]